MVRRTSTCWWRRRPRALWPWVARRRLSWATTRWTAARSCSGPLGSARSSSLRGRDGGRRLARSMASRSSSRRKWASKRRRASRGRSIASPRETLRGHRGPGAAPAPSGHLARVPARDAARLAGAAVGAAQLERAPNSLDVDADDAGALALAAEGGDGEAGKVVQRGVVAVADGLGDALAQLGEVELRAARVQRRVLLRDIALHRLGLGRAEEEPLEDEVEDAAILGRLGQRGRQRLLDLEPLPPADFAQRVERVEQLRGADGDSLGPQLLGQLEQARRQAGRLALSGCWSRWHQPGRRAGRPRARRRCRGRCGA